MAYLRVDTDLLKTTAQAIENATKKYEQYGSQLRGIASNVSLAWVGEDSSKFKRKLLALLDDDAAYKQIKRALDNYSQCLRIMASEYEKGQREVQIVASQLKR